MIFPPQIRAARALLGWNQVELAEAASVGVATLRRIEGAGTQLRGSVEVAWKIEVALEKAGVEFIPADDQKGLGVRLKGRARTKMKRARKK
ncbi:MAG: helix-turn-helix domain-containing protein [Terriglobales bacterium]